MMAVEVLGNTTREADETYGLHGVEQTCQRTVSFTGGPDGYNRLEHSEGNYTAGTIVDDDIPKRLGKAPKRVVHVANWHDEYGIGQQCEPDDKTGTLNGFGAWGYFVDGCQQALVFPCDTGSV